MSEIWKRWEGQVIEHKYRLESLIGSTDHSVVFRAEYRGPEPRKATVKLVSADTPNAGALLAGWNQAAQLSHPNLQRILQTGQCQLEDMELLYVAMEYADENLAEIIPQRALTPDETREAMNAIVDVLVYLHGKGLTHGHVCPANILAVGEFLKVSSDTIEPLAEKREMTRERSEYDAPEIPGTPYTQAADVWSLGVSLVEMLTQQRATLPFDERLDPVIPEKLREPYLEIARNALRRKPQQRWTAAQIAERLNPSAVAVKAVAAAAPSASPAKTVTSAVGSAATGEATSSAQSASVAQAVSAAGSPGVAGTGRIEPLSVPLSKEPAVPLVKQQRPPAPPTHRTAPRPRESKRETFVLPNYAVPLLLIVVLAIGAIALPKILRNRAETKTNPVAASAPVQRVPPTVEVTKAPEASTAQTGRGAAPKEEASPSAPPAVSAATTPAPAPAVMRNVESSPAAKTRNTSDSQERGEVLEQALPQVSPKALSTISGTVRIVVRAHVDAAGQVADTDLQEPGPSKYFADKAAQAARRWVFSPPEVNGRSVASDWTIRFEYTSSGVKAYPQQATQ